MAEQSKRGPGRPRKSDAERRTTRPLFIRLSDAERQLVDDAGWPDVTAWARHILVSRARSVLVFNDNEAREDDNQGEA